MNSILDGAEESVPFSFLSAARRQLSTRSVCARRDVWRGNRNGFIAWRSRRFPVEVGKVAFDPEAEVETDNQDRPGNGNEFGGDEGIPHQGKEVVARQAAHKDGGHVAFERITAGGTEDAEDVEGDEGGKGGQRDGQEGGL